MESNAIASIEEVELFLKNVREKMEFHPTGIVFRPRDKNLDTLAALDIIPGHRNEVIRKLTAQNYMGGPKNDTEAPAKPNYYEFGVMIKNREVYIKLSTGLYGKPVDCMSFHIAERKIQYPLKDIKK